MNWTGKCNDISDYAKSSLLNMQSNSLNLTCEATQRSVKGRMLIDERRERFQVFSKELQ